MVKTRFDITVSARFLSRRDRWFNRLCKPLYATYCSTWLWEDFLRYQRMDMFIHDMLLHLAMKKHGLPHCFIRYSHDRLAVAVMSA